MKMKLFGMLLLASMSINAMAQTTPRERKIARTTAKSNQARINKGVESGELTKSERLNIATDRKEIKSDVQMAKADGNITRPEKKELAKDQAKLNNKIYRKKHNDRTRN